MRRLNLEEAIQETFQKFGPALKRLAEGPREEISNLKHLLWMVVGPSGTGKDTLMNGLVRELGDIHVAISHTTRPMRPGEIDGKNYHYVTREDFLEMMNRGEFLEYVEYAGNYYGVARKEIDEALETQDVMIIVEGHGARQLLGYYPNNSKVIFLTPPPVQELRARMEARGDKPEAIEARLDPKHFTREMGYLALADIVIRPASIEAMLQAGLGAVKQTRTTFEKQKEALQSWH